MVTAKQFIDMCVIPYREGWGYIYGQWGATWTKAKQAAATREMTVRYGAKWIGKRVTDCSGLIRWALSQLGESISHHALYQYTDYSAPKGKLVNGLREDGTVPNPGTAVFLQGKEAKIHHVGVYVGGGVCIEAKGTVYGVVTSKLEHWDHWGELKMVDYSEAWALEEGFVVDPATPEDRQAGFILTATVDNPNTWLNVRTGAGSEFPVAFQVERGSTVEVLDAGEPDWWQIRYGGRIGWAFAQYLQVIGPAAEQAKDSQEVANNATETDPAPAPAPLTTARIWAELIQIRETLADLTARIDRLRSLIDSGEG